MMLQCICCNEQIVIDSIYLLASAFPLAYVFRFVFDGVLNEKNINVCLFIFFQLKTIFINKNKSDNSVKNPAHPERSRSEFEAFSYSHC